MYSYQNLLHPDIFVSARFIESELVKMGIELFHGTKIGACGITTTGGTESILLALMSYRNEGMKKGIKWPEV
jgi:sphinganine-1-phosphate aldolase